MFHCNFYSTRNEIEIVETNRTWFNFWGIYLFWLGFSAWQVGKRRREWKFRMIDDGKVTIFSLFIFYFIILANCRVKICFNSHFISYLILLNCDYALNSNKTISFRRSEWMHFSLPKLITTCDIKLIRIRDTVIKCWRVESCWLIMRTKWGYGGSETAQLIEWNQLYWMSHAETSDRCVSWVPRCFKKNRWRKKSSFTNWIHSVEIRKAVNEFIDSEYNHL